MDLFSDFDAVMLGIVVPLMVFAATAAVTWKVSRKKYLNHYPRAIIFTIALCVPAFVCILILLLVVSRIVFRALNPTLL